MFNRARLEGCWSAAVIAFVDSQDTTGGPELTLADGTLS